MATYSAAQFDKCVELVSSLPKDGPVKPTQADQLKFYGYFKQAKEGDNTKPKPGMMDFAGKAKWAAWNEVAGTSEEDAKSKYVEHFVSLLDSAGAEGGALKAEIDAVAK